MDGNNRLMASHSAVDQSGHELVTLSIKPALGTPLRNAIGQLSAAQILIGRYGNSHRTRDAGVCRTVPVNMEFPGIDTIVPQDVLQLRPTCRHHDVGCAAWR